jgi:hypothetical protein
MLSFLFWVLLVTGFWPAISLTAQERPSLFTELGFNGKRTISQQIYEESVDRAVLTNGVGKFLLAADEACRKGALKIGKSPNQIGSLSGACLEYSVLVALHEKKRTPAYYQAELIESPNNVFDVLLWTKEHGPVVLSCKTSLRERYKQADLEGQALSKLYPAARSYLVTLDADKQHVATCRRKITAREITGLAAIYDEINIDELFAWLAKQAVIDVPEGKLKRARLIR